MDIQKINVSQINPAPYNPRITLRPGLPEYERLKQSINTFGLVDPLIWNKETGNLVGGHQRLAVLIEQGVKEVEVSVINFSLEKEKALNLALNKIRGDWDENKLALLLEELTAMPEFNFSITGFSLPEACEILDNFHEAKEDDNFDFDACMESIKEPITKEGDLIQIGPHRILCGDAGKQEHITLLLGTEKINLLHTDPPYNVAYYGGNRPNAHSRPKKHKLWDRIYSDDMTQVEYEKWFKNILSNINPHLAEGAPVYIWNGHRQFGPMYLMLTELGFHVSCIITWAKERFAIGFGDYNQQTEFCLYGWKENNGSHIWHGPNNESTLWEIYRDLTRDYIHPTQKPIALAQRAMRNSSTRNDLVVDLFLGSGSTLIAAESLQRRCFGMEIDPRYCDGIVRRYIAFVGKEKVSEEMLQKYIKEGGAQ